MNIVILAGIWQVFRRMRSGHYDEAALEEQLTAAAMSVTPALHAACAR